MRVSQVRLSKVANWLSGTGLVAQRGSVPMNASIYAALLAAPGVPLRIIKRLADRVAGTVSQHSVILGTRQSQCRRRYRHIAGIEEAVDVAPQ